MLSVLIRLKTSNNKGKQRSLTKESSSEVIKIFREVQV